MHAQRLAAFFIGHIPLSTSQPEHQILRETKHGVAAKVVPSLGCSESMLVYAANGKTIRGKLIVSAHVFELKDMNQEDSCMTVSRTKVHYARAR